MSIDEDIVEKKLAPKMMLILLRLLNLHKSNELYVCLILPYYFSLCFRLISYPGPTNSGYPVFILPIQFNTLQASIGSLLNKNFGES